MRRELIALSSYIAASTAALAQSSTAPAQMGITPATVPEVLQVLDNTKNWVDIGTVNSANHTFLGRAGVNETDIVVTDPAIGMKAGGFDNSPFVDALMNAQNPGAWGGYDVTFPAIPGQATTIYYFSQPLVNRRNGNYHCSGGTQNPAVYLVFAAGVDGFVNDDGHNITDGGSGGGMLSGCMIVSQGYGVAASNTATPTTLTGVVFNNVAGAPASSWHVGDGILLTMNLNGSYPASAVIAAPIGTTISAIDGATGNLTLSNPMNQSVGHSGMTKATVAFTQTGTNNFSAGDTIKVGPLTYTFTAAGGVSYSAPLSIFVGPDFTTSAGNLVAALTGDWGQFTKYAPNNQGEGAYWFDQLVTASYASGVITFSSRYGGLDTNAYPAIYTPAGTPAGSFSAAHFSGATGGPVNVAFYQLPATQEFKVQTTSGSSTVTVISGPRLLRQGDVIWSDAFRFGTTVRTASGATFPQTITMTDAVATSNNVNATLTHAPGAEGNLWIVPAGNKRRATASAEHNKFLQWPLGQSMACSDPLNCDLSRDVDNYHQVDFVGRWVAGDNTATASSKDEQFGSNYLMDVWEGGTLGENYFNLNTESVESGTARWGIIQNCANQNYTTIFGGYISNTPGCTFDEYAYPPTYGGPAAFGMVNYAGNLGAFFTRRNVFSNGISVIGGPDQQCIDINGQANTWYLLQFSAGAHQCGAGDIVAFTWDGINKDFAWVFQSPNAGSMRFVDVNWGWNGYGGINGTGVYFPNGVLLTSGEAATSARSFGASAAPNPGGQHAQGDADLNVATAKGGNALWASALNFTTTLAGNVIAGTTTSVQVGACPPAATFQSGVSDVTPAAPVFLGLFQSCVGTTLTFDGAGYHNANSGDAIQFLEWYPAAKIANDLGGTSWPVATAVAIASLTSCNAAAVGFGVVTNGVATGSAGYGAAVSATGSSTRPVFCDGTSWTYH